MPINHSYSVCGTTVFNSAISIKILNGYFTNIRAKIKTPYDSTALSHAPNQKTTHP
jgi:hypothetical protein